jgi:peptidoglycan glycosyltransferase
MRSLVIPPRPLKSRRVSRRAPLFALLAILAASWFWLPHFLVHQQALASSAAEPARVSDVPALPIASPQPSLHDVLVRTDHRFDEDHVASAGEGARRHLTLDTDLQTSTERLLDGYQVPLGEVVALDPATGHVLAYVRSSSSGPTADGLDPDGCYPAASVFKLVTAAALLERGVPADEEVCYHGGKHRLRSKNLEDDDRRDRRCATLAEAVAHSTNAAMAKLADRNLDPIVLQGCANQMLFNQPLPCDAATPVSRAEIPSEPFDFATTAAGFGQVTLSPLHAAALAGAIGRGGLLMPPRLVEGDDANPPHPVRLMPEAVAEQLGDMMELAVQEGTAHRAFRSRRRRELDAAGKTGSITTHDPFRDYSWFVGFAPRRDPRIAVAALIVNGPRWRVHATSIAESVLESYLKAHPLVARVAAAPGRVAGN